MRHWHVLHTRLRIPPRKILVLWGFFLLVFFGLLFSAPLAQADTVAELREKIEQRNSQLEELEAEIARFEAELTKVGADRKTLEAEIARLDLSRKKIATDIAVTQNRIDATGFELEELGATIEIKEKRIEESRFVIKKTLRLISQIDETPIAEHFLSGVDFSDAWEEADQLRRIQHVLGDEVVELEATRAALEADYISAAEKQGELISFRKQLSGQKSVLDQNRQTQSVVLSETRDKESEYQSLLAAKREAFEQIQAELREFEAELEYTLDPTDIPSPGSGIFTFPLDPAFIERCAARESAFGNIYCITQYFGNTAFAQSGAYNGQGHNGMDFGAPEGTRVISALSGIVTATGDTDAITAGTKVFVTFSQVNVRNAPNGSIVGSQRSRRTGEVVAGPVSAGQYSWWKINFASGSDGWVADIAVANACYSYGKWILVTHANGLATLYAHLSHIGVSQGEPIGVGGFLGYSGNTGYSTGPHLHFTAYVADEVRVVKLGEVKSSTNCPAARIPVAPTEAYLNPIDYL
ncbi:MAG: peptidoglycan DD-metalloendopeptidase family protein [Patescibacteria group bacterium UBA2163]